MDDLWGDDDIDADVVEECVLLATQASFCPSPKNNQQTESSFVEPKSKSLFEFKQPSNAASQFTFKKELSTSISNSSAYSLENKVSNNGNTLDSSNELQLLKDENKKLSEANLIKTGETSILRSDLQNLRSVMEKREAEANQQLASLHKQIQQLNDKNNKLLESSKTEIKFKELELEEMRNKCKRLENSNKLIGSKEPVRNIRNQTSALSVSTESPLGKKFLNKTTFHMGNHIESTVRTIDTGVQTESFKRFRLNSCEAERLDNGTDTTILIEKLKYSLLSSNSVVSYSMLLEQLKIRMIYSEGQKKLAELFCESDVNVAEMICKRLEQDRGTDRLKFHLEFLSCWITHILPLLPCKIQEQFIHTVLSDIKRISYLDILAILSSIVARFGVAPICNRPSGCLLEKVALSLKELYLSLNVEEQIQTAQKVVLILSAMVASSSSVNVKKCACIPHLLKLLVFIVQHQAELEGLASHITDLRFKMLVQAFRLSISILNSRREPWITFKHSPAEINRLYTVLTVISVEFPLPKEISPEINVSAFTLPGFGL